MSMVKNENYKREREKKRREKMLFSHSQRTASALPLSHTHTLILKVRSPLESLGTSYILTLIANAK